MKPTVSEREVTSTLEGECIDLSFDTTAMVHLMNIMIDLYNDSEMAVLREYSTNALDAHIEAGVDEPIEVELPTTLQPVLIIRDQGLGLDLDDIREIYSKYGASTKRDSNEVTGMLGLGCKSALTYTDQFTIQAVKDGVRTVVAVSRNAEGAGAMTVVEQIETDDANGVEIVIPTKRYNDFEQKAAELFQYWPEHSVLVDGEYPKRFEALEATDGIYLQATNSTYYDQQKPSTVVMGNVPYAIKLSDLGLDFHNASAKQRVIAYVPMGSVEVQPSREGLRLTSQTQATLADVGARLKAHATAAAAQSVEDQSTAYEAAREVERVKGEVPKCFWPDKWEWRGVEIPQTFTLEVETLSTDNYGYAKKQRGGFVVVNAISTGKNHSRLKQVPLGTMSDALFFYGFDVDFTSNHRRRLDQWKLNNSFMMSTPAPRHYIPSHYILVQEKPSSPFIDPNRIFDWNEVKKTKLPANARTESGRLVGSYDAFLPGCDKVKIVLAADIDQDLPIYCFVQPVTKARWGKTRAQQALPYVKAINEDCTVVLFADNRLDKFLRQFPGTKDIREVIGDRFKAWSSKLTEDQKQALAAHKANQTTMFNRLDAARIDDPTILEAIRITKIQIDSMVMGGYTYAQLGYHLELPIWYDPFERYPLCSSWYTEQGSDHVYLYINAAYAAYYKGQS